jgi:transposase InsO family protein
MRICHEQNITHKLIPPGEKELQGLVERSHRQDDQELFSNIEPENLTQFNKSLDEYFKFRNERRRFKKLSWLTPNEYLSQEKDEEAEHVTKLVA